MVLFSKKIIEINNVFSPFQQSLKMLIKKNNLLNIEKVKKDDAFNNFFREVIKNLKNKNLIPIIINLFDAQFRDKLK